jgi:outer membrane protein assembly factor BamB
MVALTLIVPASRLSGATLTLSVTVGPPSLRIVATGSGFGPIEVVDISFDARQIARATTNGAGSFSRKIRVPGQAVPGEHTVGAIGESSGTTAETVFTVRTDWPTERFDQRGSAFNSLENVISPLTVTGLRVKGMVELDLCPVYLCPQPVVANGLLYDTDEAGARAFDASTGAAAWTTDLNRDLGGVTATKEAAFTATSGGANPTVWALDPLSGDVLWSAVIQDVDGGLTRPVVAAETVFVATKGATLVALDAATGTEVWRMTGTSSFSVPAIVGGVAYTHQSGGTLLALDAATGAVIWQVDAGGAGPANETTTVAGGRVFAFTINGALEAFDAVTGLLDWSADVGKYPGPEVAVADGVVLARSSESDVHVEAFDAETGAELWTSPELGYYSDATPTVANGLVFIGAQYSGFSGCGVCALDALTGEMVWSSDGGGMNPDYGSATVVNGMVYATYYDTGGGPSGLRPLIVVFGLP